MAMSFEERISAGPAGPNIVLSYGVKEDKAAAELGFSFLGIAYDAQGHEVHVFKSNVLPVGQRGN